MLFDNFHNYGTGNNGTGTVYMDQVNVIPQPNQYTIDWNKVVQNTNDAVQYSVDTDTNGTYETTTNLTPVFQDLIPPTTTATLSGTLVPNSTTSYYEQTQITLSAIDPIVNTLPGSGVKTIYFTLDTQNLTYIPLFLLRNSLPCLLSGLSIYLKYCFKV